MKHRNNFRNTIRCKYIHQLVVEKWRVFSLLGEKARIFCEVLRSYIVAMNKSVFTSLTITAVFIVGTVISSISLADDYCRSCHNQNPPAGIPVDPTAMPKRHHLLLYTPVPVESDVPNPEGNYNGMYSCASCHYTSFDPITLTYMMVPFDDCLGCHQPTVHDYD